MSVSMPNVSHGSGSSTSCRARAIVLLPELDPPLRTITDTAMPGEGTERCRADLGRPARAEHRETAEGTVAADNGGPGGATMTLRTTTGPGYSELRRSPCS